jgi:putative transposase
MRRQSGCRNTKCGSPLATSAEPRQAPPLNFLNDSRTPSRAYVPKTQQSMVAAAVRQAFLQPDRAQASQMLRHVADQLRPKWPKLAGLIDDSETEVLCYLDFPEQHRSKLHSTNPLERPNKEVKRRADVVGIFPNEAAIIRLIGAVLLEQNDEWQLQHRYMQVEAMTGLVAAPDAADPRQITCAA